jgi:hypothetical protein
VHAVVHGHAHKGSPQGKTAHGIPVYNVALPVLKEHYPDRPPYRLLEVPLTAAPDEEERPVERRRA